MALIQKSFSDLITFTRASGGGRFNASGQYEWLPADQPRFDYDPVTGEAKGLLIEEQRTNLLTYSNEFGGSVWTKTNVTVTPSSVRSRLRDGVATEIRATSAAAEHHIQQMGPNAAGVYTAQFVVNAAGATGEFALMSAHVGETQSTSFARFALNAGVVSLITFNNRITAASSLALGEGYYLCWITYSITASTTYHSARLYPEGVSTAAGVGRPIFLDAVQLEAGSFP